MSKNTCFTYGGQTFIQKWQQNSLSNISFTNYAKERKNGANIVMAFRLWLAVYLVPLFYFRFSLDYFSDFKCIL